jgi:eukaryotic-like serine/threonine-protein kinase
MLRSLSHQEPALRVGASTEQARAFLQRRLALFAGLAGIFSLGFLVAVPLVGLLLLSGAQRTEYMRSPSFAFHGLATLVTLGNWAFLRLRRLGAGGLLVDDLLCTVASSTLLALMGAGIPDRYGYIQALLATSLIIHIRGVVVPSSGRRTFAISATCAAAATIAVILFVPRRAPAPGMPLASAAEIAVNMGLWLAASTAIATVSARIIFGLREEVKVARQIGQYVLERKIGEGGMGIVYLATHALLRRRTALKLLLSDKVDPHTLMRFEREVRQLARLSHPNTVAIYDYGRTPEGTFYFAMEYLEGLGLDDLVGATGAVPASRVVHLLDQICGSLVEAHDMGLVHRDIKPANVMVCEQGGAPDVVKVLDFGLVKDTGNPRELDLTANSSFVGTPLYACPEAIKGGEITAASDMYAVAAVGYYLLTGTEVFSGATLMEIGGGHLYKNPEPPSARLGREVPAALEQLILRGLAKEPSARPRDARAFRQALKACAIDSWPEEDARGWWESVGRELVRQRLAKTIEQDTRTLAVSLAGREE